MVQLIDNIINIPFIKTLFHETIEYRTENSVIAPACYINKKKEYQKITISEKDSGICWFHEKSVNYEMDMRNVELEIYFMLNITNPLFENRTSLFDIEKTLYHAISEVVEGTIDVERDAERALSRYNNYFETQKQIGKIPYLVYRFDCKISYEICKEIIISEGRLYGEGLYRVYGNTSKGKRITQLASKLATDIDLSWSIEIDQNGQTYSSKLTLEQLKILVGGGGSTVFYQVDTPEITAQYQIWIKSDTEQFFLSVGDGWTEINYVTHSQLNTILADFVTDSELGTLLSNYITLGTPQTITAKKTFINELPESAIVPTENNDFVNKLYVDNVANTKINKTLTENNMLIGDINDNASEIPTTNSLIGIGTFVNGVCSIVDVNITNLSVFKTGLKTCTGWLIRGVFNTSPNRITFTSYTLAGAVANTDNGTFCYTILI